MGKKKDEKTIKPTVKKQFTNSIKQLKMVQKTKCRGLRRQRQQAGKLLDMVAWYSEAASVEAIRWTREREKQVDQVIKMAAALEKEQGDADWEDLPTKVPKIPKKFVVGSEEIYNGNRNTLRFTDSAISTVVKKNIQKHKGLLCPGNKRKKQPPHSINKKDVSIDHITPWSKYQHEVDSYTICYKGWHFSVQTQDDMEEAYNDIKNLRVMCQSCNSSKGGVKGGDYNGPTSMGACEFGGGIQCKFPKA